MSTVSTRLSALEKTLRTEGRNEFIKSVDADFAASMQRAAANDGALKLLKDARNDVVRKGQRAAEDAAIEAFLAAKAPEARPFAELQLIRLDANGKRLADSDSAEHIAVLVPNYALGQDLLIDARAPTPIDQIKHAAKKAGEIKLFGEPIALLSDVQWNVIIDRRYCDPAVHPYFAKTSPTGRWYPTSSPLMEKNGKPNSSGDVWAVGLAYGGVAYVSPYGVGFVRGGRLVPASQY